MGNEDSILIHDLKVRLYEVTVKHMEAFNMDNLPAMHRYAGQMDLLNELIAYYS